MRHTKWYVKAMAWFFGLSLVFSLFMAATLPQPASSAPTVQEKKEQDEELARKLRTVQAAMVLQNAARNPDSFKLVHAIYHDDGTICFQYRAQNGFGGMNVEFAVETPKGNVSTNDDVYRHYCGKGRTGEEMVQ